MGLPPDQPTTLLWMYCAETASEAEEGWEYFRNQLLAAQHHYFEWNNPGYAGIPGYEEYLKRQTADVGVADASLAARRATQPIGTPDEIIEKIRALQHALSLEMVVIHMFYGGMPRAKAEKSLRLFAEKVLPAVQGDADADQPGVARSAREVNAVFCARLPASRHIAEEATMADLTRTIEVKPLTLHIGAEISGVDLGRPLDVATRKAINDALCAGRSSSSGASTSITGATSPLRDRWASRPSATPCSATSRIFPRSTRSPSSARLRPIVVRARSDRGPDGIRTSPPR
jgi:hypothetical protein